MPKLKEEPGFRRIEIKIAVPLYKRLKGAADAKVLSVSYIIRKGVEMVLPVIERDPNTGAPEELTRRLPRPEVRAWEPSRPLRSQGPGGF